MNLIEMSYIIFLMSKDPFNVGRRKEYELNVLKNRRNTEGPMINFRYDGKFPPVSEDPKQTNDLRLKDDH